MPNVLSKPILPFQPLPLPQHLNQRPLVLSFLILLLLRSRALTLSQEALDAVVRAVRSMLGLKEGLHRKREKLNSDELARVLQQVCVEEGNDEKDGVKTLLVPYRERVVKVPIRPTPPSKFTSDAPHFPPLSPTSTALAKPNIDHTFLSQLHAILSRIAIPSFTSPESGIVVLHSTFLVLRTVLSILVARLDGRIVRDLVKGDGKGFLKGLALWFLFAVPSTVTNSMIRHLQSLLALRLRTRLTRYLHDLYLSSNPDLRYYRAGAYLEGIDQYLTADVEAWANSLSGVYGNVLKPSLDLLLFTSQLSRSLGVRGTLLLFLNYYSTVFILRSVTPAFGRLAAIEAKLEGEYRAGVGRVGREAEEVAFYDGGGRERGVLADMYKKLIRHINLVYKIRIAYEWTEDYVIKYLWSAAGYALIAVPILFTRTKRSLGMQSGMSSSSPKDEAIAGRTETYISNRRLLLSLADAGGRLMYAYKDLLELAGLTARLYTLLSTLLNMPKGRVPKLLVERCKDTEVGEIRVKNVDVRIPRGARPLFGLEEEVDGNDEKDNDNDPPLVSDLNLTVRPGEHLMITGSNGVGKTAVARVLAGLWETQERGMVEMPRDESEVEGWVKRARVQEVAECKENEDKEVTPEEKLHHHTRPRPTLYVVPQRSYMPVGSLLEQIIYPCSYASFIRLTSTSPKNDNLVQLPSASALDEITAILSLVHLSYLPAREGGLHVRKEWRDVLSGGEKQRMALARVMWWRPRYAVLDECTSAVSADVEGRMYESMKTLGVTLVTISLRPSLAKYHKQLLTLDGPSGSHPGKWTLARVGTEEERMSIQKEIKVLEEKLREVEGWERRVKELEVMLGVQEGVAGEGVGEDGDSASESLLETSMVERDADFQQPSPSTDAQEEEEETTAADDLAAVYEIRSGWSGSDSIDGVSEDGLEEPIDPAEEAEILRELDEDD